MENVGFIGILAYPKKKHCSFVSVEVHTHSVRNIALDKSNLLILAKSTLKKIGHKA